MEDHVLLRVLADALCNVEQRALVARFPSKYNRINHNRRRARAGGGGVACLECWARAREIFAEMKTIEPGSDETILLAQESYDEQLRPV